MRIACVEGKDKDCVWELKFRRSVIGRNTHCDIVLTDSKVSRVHAEVVHEGEAFILYDRDSRNGSYINNNRITSQRLTPGDIIRLGNTTFKVIGQHLTTDVSWYESDPFVTNEISLQQLSSQIEETISASRTPRVKKRDPVRRKHRETLKLIKNLETIYQVGNMINSIQNVDEMLEQIADTMLAVFLGAQRVCILLDGKRKGADFEPKIIKTRPGLPSGPFLMSRSIVNQSVKEQLCILADDAMRDERFSASDSVPSIHIRSVMCAPLVSKGAVLGLIYLDNREKPKCFDDNDMALLSALANQSAVAIENSRLYEDVQKSYHEAILALMNMMNAKDPYTRGHSKRTAHCAFGIAREMGLSEEQCIKIQTAAELHDIGKIGVRDFIISKDSPLSTGEFDSIQTHVLSGENIIRPIEYLRFSLPMIRHHHENFDGTGYPDGLKGDKIPLGARIIAAADAFDAMTSQRPYNKPVRINKALKKCVSLKARQFDPDVIDALVRFAEKNYTALVDTRKLSDLKTEEDFFKRKKPKPKKE